MAEKWQQHTNSDNVNLISGLRHYHFDIVKSNLKVALFKHDRANRNAGSSQFVKITTLKLQLSTILTVLTRPVQAPVAICGDCLGGS